MACGHPKKDITIFVAPFSNRNENIRCAFPKNSNGMRDHCALNDQNWKTHKCAGIPNIRWDLIQTSRVFQASKHCNFQSFSGRINVFLKRSSQEATVCFRFTTQISSRANEKTKKNKSNVPLAEPPGIHPMSKQVKKPQATIHQICVQPTSIVLFFFLQFTE